VNLSDDKLEKNKAFMKTNFAKESKNDKIIMLFNSNVFKYRNEIKLKISTETLKDKLAEQAPFNKEISLPKNVVVNDDNFDSEKSDTYWYARNFLFNYLNNYYKTRQFSDEDKLQEFYKVTLEGTEETGKDQDNTNIILHPVEKDPTTFTTWKIKNFSFQVNVKVRDHYVEQKQKMTYNKEEINLIISFNKLKEKINQKKTLKAENN
jgi:hypothetical protein